MINLTEEKREYYISRLRTRIASLQGAQRETKLGSQQEDSLIFYRMALAMLENIAKPVAKIEVIEGQFCNFITGEILDPDFADWPKTEVYTMPPIPMVLPVILQGGSLKSDGNFWYKADTVIAILRKAGFTGEIIP